MRTLNAWMRDYAVSHTHPTNKIIHYYCVPLIMLSLFGLLSFVSLPFIGDIHYLFNASSLLALFILGFYFCISKRLFIIMLPIFSLFQVLIYTLLYYFYAYVFNFFLLLFIVSWILQLIGHKIEGKKPSFIDDLLFLFIGPIWVFVRIPFFAKFIKFNSQEK